MSMRVDDEGFLRAIGSAYAVMRSDAGRSGTDVIYDVFGQTRIADTLALATVPDADDGDDNVDTDVFWREVLATVSRVGVVGWLFRMVQTAGERLHASSYDDDSAARGMDDLEYLDEVCRLGAHVLFGWGTDDAWCITVARALLTGDYEGALNLMLPESNIVFAADAADDVGLRSHDDAYAVKPRSTVLITKEAQETFVQNDSGVHGPGVSGVETAAPLETLALAGRQYVFDAEHVVDAYRWFAGRSLDVRGAFSSDQADADSPWFDRDFAYRRLASTAGPRIVAPYLEHGVDTGDEAMLNEGLSILRTFCEFAGEHGLDRLPVMALSAIVGLGDDGTEGGPGQEISLQLRKEGADMAAVMLSYVADPLYAKSLAAPLLRLDLEQYEAVLQTMSGTHGEQSGEINVDDKAVS